MDSRADACWAAGEAAGAVGVTSGLETLFVVALVAALAPMVVAVLPGPRIPQVVVFLLGGILIGPHVLGAAETSNIQLLANIGLGFLFLLAGYELDPALLRQRPGKLAMIGWLISAVLAVAAAAALTAAGYINFYDPAALTQTSTASLVDPLRQRYIIIKSGSLR